MEDDDMAVDMVLWALLAAMAGLIACGCIVTRKPADGGHAAMRGQYGGGRH
jgi:hypothetical protein